MINAKHPLIETVDGKPFSYPPVDISDEFDKQNFSLTKIGEQVLNAEISNLDLNGRDRHWGALEFSGNKYWQYDKQAQSAVFSD